MVMILIKSPDKWATTKQACTVELKFRIYFFFFSFFFFFFQEMYELIKREKLRLT